MPKRRRHIVSLMAIAALYLITWIGGWVTYKHDFVRRIHARHAQALQQEAQMKAICAQQGWPFEPIGIFPEPHVKVNICLPVLPGLLIADSSYVMAPLWGEGGLKIIVYYGLGTLEFPIGNWRA